MKKKLLSYTILMLVVFSIVSVSTIAIKCNNQYLNVDDNSFDNTIYNAGDINISLEIIAEDFVSPIALTNPGDGTNRVFVADQTGIVHVIENDILLETPFLDITDRIVNLNTAYDERGLLGIAFHPNYIDNGRFYVYFSAPKTGPDIDHESILEEYTVSSTDPNVADPNSAKIIFRVDQPESNHNGGQLEFGPDGFLYIGLGDGGGAGDIHGTIGNGQDINTSLGAILRIDVDSGSPYSIPLDNPFVGADGLDEIYAFGFRNPWKFSFDSETDELFVADVGQDLWEEVDIVIIGGNYGWRIMEGTHFYDEELLDILGLTIEDLEMPIHEYSHDIGKSIVGGYVYRKNPASELYGKYVFGDWSSSFGSPAGKLYFLEEVAPDTYERFNLLVGGSNNINRFILSFGEDELGNIYLLSKTTLGPSGTTGDVRRIVPDNQQPTKPSIDGPKSGKVGIEYNYTFSGYDPDNDDLLYFIDWGDGFVEEWIGPYASGEELIVSHTFESKGFFIIKAKTRDTSNVESDWGQLIVRIPRYSLFQNSLILNFLQRFFHFSFIIKFAYLRNQ